MAASTFAHLDYTDFHLFRARFSLEYILDISIYHFPGDQKCNKSIRPESESQLLALQSLQELSDCVSNLEELILIEFW